MRNKLVKLCYKAGVRDMPGREVNPAEIAEPFAAWLTAAGDSFQPV